MGRKKNSEQEITDILVSKKYTKSNALVNSKGHAGLLAEKLFAVGIQQATEDEKTGILSVTIRGADLKRIFQTNRGTFYKDVLNVVEPPTKDIPSLLDWRIVYKDDKTQTIEAINVITDCSFKDNVLSITFNSKVTPQVRKLQANYTVYSLADTMPLKSIYSFKLYEILKSEYDRQDYLAKKKGIDNPNPVFITEMHIADLKLRVGIIDSSWSADISQELKKTEPNYEFIEKLADELLKNDSGDKSKKTYKSYRRIDNFKKNVLERARQELQEKTSIKFRYETLTGGAGGKVYGIRFYISRNIKRQEEVIVDEEPKEISKTEMFSLAFKVQTLLGPEFTTEDVLILMQEANYNFDRISQAHEVYLQQKGTDKISNGVGFMRDAIKKNWTKNKERKSTNKFNDFPQNEYDFEELENQLVEN